VAIPLPRADTTPPVTNINFGITYYDERTLPPSIFSFSLGVEACNLHAPTPFNSLKNRKF